MKLKEFMKLQLLDNTTYGRPTSLMIWSPVHHYWFDDISNEKDKKWLLKQKIQKIGLRDSAPGKIAIFLEEYTKEKRAKIRKKLRKGN